MVQLHSASAVTDLTVTELLSHLRMRTVTRPHSPLMSITEPDPLCVAAADAIEKMAAGRLTFSEEQIDAAAEALRFYKQGHRRLSHWGVIPNSTRNKWRDDVRFIINCLGDAVR